MALALPYISVLPVLTRPCLTRHASPSRRVLWPTPKDGNTALHIASKEGQLEACKSLIAAGCSTAKTNNVGARYCK